MRAASWLGPLSALGQLHLTQGPAEGARGGVCMCGVSRGVGTPTEPLWGEQGRLTGTCVCTAVRGAARVPAPCKAETRGLSPQSRVGSAAQGMSKVQKPGWTHRAQRGWGGAPRPQSQSRRVSPAPSLGLSAPRQAEGGGELRSPASPQPPRCPGKAVGGRRGPGYPHQLPRGGARCTVAMVTSSPVSLQPL